MRRYPCLLLLLAAPATRTDLSAQDAAPLWPRLPAGAEFLQAIALDERQAALPAARSGSAAPNPEPIAGVFTRLQAEVRWRVRKASDKEILLDGSVVAGQIEIEEKPLANSAVTQRFPLAGLGLKARLSSSAAHVEPDAKGWAGARSAWLREAKALGIGDERRDAAEAAASRAIREVPRLVLHFALPGRAPRLAEIRVERALRRLNGEPSGTITLAIRRSPESSSKDGLAVQGSFGILHEGPRKRSAIPNLVRRTGFVEPTDLGPSEIGQGALLWDCVSQARPFAWLSLEGRAPYHDPEEQGVYGVDRDVGLEYSFRFSCRAPDAEAPPLRAESEGLPRLPDLHHVVAARGDDLSKTVLHLWQDPEKALQAAEEYARIEEEGRLSLDARTALHYALVEELSLLAFRQERKEVRDAVEAWALKETRLALFVLGLRVLASPYASLPDAARVRLFSEVSRRPEPELAAWGGKFLALVPWDGAVEALVKLLEDAAADPRRSRDLCRSFELDLFRVLGPSADGRWREVLADLEKKRRNRPYAFTHVPRKDPPGTIRSALLRRLTEGSSLRVVFVLDTSTSMTKLLRWGRSEILLALKQFTPNVLFGIVHFNKKAVRWRGSLVSATPGAFAEASKHLASLDNLRGSNLHATAWSLGLYETVDTVIIISDGAVPAAAAREFLEWNCLRGARVIAYGFSPSMPERPGILEQLSRVHFGWYEQVVVEE